jgi:hypothetical protein
MINTLWAHNFLHLLIFILGFLRSFRMYHTNYDGPALTRATVDSKSTFYNLNLLLFFLSLVIQNSKDGAKSISMRPTPNA